MCLEACETSVYSPGLKQWKEKIDTCRLASDLQIDSVECECLFATLHEDGDDGGGDDSEDDDDKCNKKKNKGLSPQNETRYWPGYLSTVACQGHSKDAVHPSGAGPQALDSSAIEEDTV